MPGILRILPIHFVFLLVAFAAAAAAICNAYYDGQKSAALRAGAPAAIPLSRLGPVAKYPTFQEIRVEAQTSDALVYVSWFDSSRGMIEYPIVFFVDPAHEGPVQEVLAAAPFVGSDLRNFEAFMAASARGYGPIGRILEINGARKSSQSLMSDEYAWAAMDMGLSLHPDFVVIDPFTEGREAGLATQPVITYALGGVAVVLVWLSIFVRSLMRRLLSEQERKAHAKRGIERGALSAVFAIVAAAFAADG